MKLRFYDIVSQLIPGLMVYFSFMYLWDVPQQWQKFLPAFAFAMAIGFFVNALSSWLEPIFYWTWGGKPSNQLLNGKDIAKVKFHEKEKVTQLLQNNYPEANKDALFQIAYRLVSSTHNEKIQVFNENFSYARSLLTTGLILAILFLLQYYCIWWVWLIALVVILMLWQRAKERGFYFAREVLSTYLSQV
jgi:hypothetical protein